MFRSLSHFGAVSNVYGAACDVKWLTSTAHTKYTQHTTVQLSGICRCKTYKLTSNISRLVRTRSVKIIQFVFIYYGKLYTKNIMAQSVAGRSDVRTATNNDEEEEYGPQLITKLQVCEALFPLLRIVLLVKQHQSVWWNAHIEFGYNLFSLILFTFVQWPIGARNHTGWFKETASGGISYNRFVDVCATENTAVSKNWLETRKTYRSVVILAKTDVAIVIFKKWYDFTNMQRHVAACMGCLNIKIWLNWNWFPVGPYILAI